MIDTPFRKRVLVTGGSGFLGWHLAMALRQNHNVAYTYSTQRIGIPGCREFHMDLSRPFTIVNCLKAFQPDIVIHTAAMKDTGEAEKNPSKAFTINVVGTERIIRRLGNPRTLFIYISTDLVFHGDRPPYSETDSPNPLGQYGLSKWAAEKAVQRLWKNHVIARTALLYGSPNPLGRGSFLQWMDGALQRKEILTLFSDEYRTPAYVADAVRAIETILNHNGKYRIYHIGGAERISRVDFGKRLAAIRGYDASYIIEKTLRESTAAVHRARDVSLDSRRIQNAYQLRWTSIDCALREIASLRSL